MICKPLPLRSVLSDPLVLTNLAIRLSLLVFVLTTGHWLLGDTAHYLHFSEMVCAGDWGGEPSKSPLYLWFICGLAPAIKYTTSPAGTLPDPVSMARLMAVPLGAQTLLVWWCGVHLYRRSRSKWVAMFWLFDPVLMAYSNLVMSDALFGICIMAAFFALWTLVDGSAAKSGFGAPLLTGGALGLVALARPHGILLCACAGLLLIFLSLKKRLSPGSTALVFIALALAIAPRIYWNGTRHGRWALAIQGDGWIKSVAGVVENQGTGLDFPNSEKKWWHDHQPADIRAAVETIKQNWFIAVVMSLKGALRVFLGHVNVELGALFTGAAPVGPGWFHPAELREGPVVDGDLVVIWVLGMMVAAGWALYAYGRLAMVYLKDPRYFDAFSAWILIAAVVLAVVPLVYGEARFRTGVWPLILGLWGRAQIREQGDRA